MRHFALVLLAAWTAAGGAPDTGPEAQGKAPVNPRPAIAAPLASRSILLGLAHAGERLVAVGERGHILLSADGRSWRQVASPANSMLNRVRFRDDRQGWAVGHDATILATADGGETWTLQHFAAGGKPLYDLLFLDERHIVVVGGYGTYLASGDGGKTWKARSFPLTELGQHFNAIARLADDSLLIAGERGLLARSRDEGETWDLLDSPYTGSFFGVLPAGDTGALVFGLRGNIYQTRNLGACPTVDPLEYDPFTRETVSDAAALAKLGWTPIGSPTTEGLFGGRSDGQTALLVGVNGVLVRVDMAHGSATLIEAPARETLNDVIRRNESWLAVGRRGIQNLGALP